MKKQIASTVFAAVASVASGFGLLDLERGPMEYLANKSGRNVIKPSSVEVWSSVADAEVKVSRVRSVDVFTNAYDITKDVHFVVTNNVPYRPTGFGVPSGTYADAWLFNAHMTNWDDLYEGRRISEKGECLFYSNGVWRLVVKIDDEGDPDYGKFVDLCTRYPGDNAIYHDFKEAGTMTFVVSKSPYSTYQIKRFFGPSEWTTVPEVKEWTQDVTNRAWRAFSRTCYATNDICMARCTNGFISESVTNGLFIVSGDVIVTTGITKQTENEKTRAVIVYGD